MHPLLLDLVNPEPQTRGSWSWGGRYRSSVYKKDPCWACNKLPIRPLRLWSIDHLLAKSRGGTGDIHNMAPMCTECNTAKDALEPLQFLVREAQYRAGIATRHIGKARRKKLRRAQRKLLDAWVRGLNHRTANAATVERRSTGSNPVASVNGMSCIRESTCLTVYPSVAQLVERDASNVVVASSSLVWRS